MSLPSCSLLAPTLSCSCLGFSFFYAALSEIRMATLRVSWPTMTRCSSCWGQRPCTSWIFIHSRNKKQEGKFYNFKFHVSNSNLKFEFAQDFREMVFRSLLLCAFLLILVGCLLVMFSGDVVCGDTFVGVVCTFLILV